MTTFRLTGLATPVAPISAASDSVYILIKIGVILSIISASQL